MKPVIVTPDRKEEFDTLMARLEELNSEMKRLSDLHDTGHISSNEWIDQNKPLLHESFGVHAKIRNFNS